MTVDPHTPADDEYHIVTTATFVALVDIVKALNGIAQLTSSGRLDEGESEVGKGELAAMFRVVAAHLDHKLQTLPYHLAPTRAA